MKISKPKNLYHTFLFLADFIISNLTHKKRRKKRSEAGKEMPISDRCTSTNSFLTSLLLIPISSQDYLLPLLISSFLACCALESEAGR